MIDRLVLCPHYNQDGLLYGNVGTYTDAALMQCNDILLVVVNNSKYTYILIAMSEHVVNCKVAS